MRYTKQIKQTERIETMENKTNNDETKEREEDKTILAMVLDSILSGQGMLINSMATLFLIQQRTLNGEDTKDLIELVESGLKAQILALESIESTKLKLYEFMGMDELKESLKGVKKRYETPAVKVVSGRDAMEELAKILGF